MAEVPRENGSPVTPSQMNVGIAGAGVIGGGWVARWVFAGAQVKVYDPAPDAAEGIERLLGNAERALGELHGGNLSTKGGWRMVDSMEEAAEGSNVFHENVPERLELKVPLLAGIDEATSPETLVCSSTSGLLPSRLQAQMSHPERFIVAHPFNPVYLLPLVELCGGERTAPEFIEQGRAVFENLGMKPLILRQEIDGFIADRLLEALWREALWLIADGVATTEEVDDAIRYGPGLRWASMGTMLTYRIAGGTRGMQHFMEQFGPALKWPWTKLMDTPDLDENLIGRIVAQSDAQAQGAGVDELERTRDDSLVAVLKALRSIPYAAGQTLHDHDVRLGGTGAGTGQPAPGSH